MNSKVFVRSAWIVGSVLFVVVLGGRFAFLNDGDLEAWDECLYAWRAKVAVVEGEWFDQTPYAYHKFWSGSFPPLLVWQIAASFSLFGFQEWAARLPVAWHAAALMPLLVAWGYLVDARRGLVAGWLGALMLFSIPYFAEFGKMAQLDIPFIAWSMAVLVGWLAGSRGSDRSWGWTMAAGCCLGATTMTKIAIGAFVWFVIAGYELAMAALLPGSRPRHALRHLIGVGVVGCLLWAPWHIAMTMRHGSEFLRWYFGTHLFGRSGRPDFEDSPFQHWIYPHSVLEKVPTALTILAVAGLAFAMQAVVCAILAKRRGVPANDETRRRLTTLLPAALWVGFIVTLFAWSSTKRQVYLLPAYAGGALLAAQVVVELATQRVSVLTTLSLGFFLGFGHAWERMAARREAFWEYALGMESPEPGAGAFGTALSAIEPMFLWAAVGVALMASSLIVGRIAQRPQFVRFRSMAERLPAVLVVLLVSTTIWSKGIGDMIQRPNVEGRNDFIQLKPWIEDSEKFPDLAYIGFDHHDGYAAKFPYYLNGHTKSFTPIRIRPITHAMDVRDFDSLPFRHAGAALIVSRDEVAPDDEMGVETEHLPGFVPVHLTRYFIVYQWPQK